MMKRMEFRAMVFLFLTFLYGYRVQGGVGLSSDFYETSCPQVEDIVRTALSAIFLTDPTSAAALLRLMFHDCQVQGCDASILVDQSDNNVPLEIHSARNFGVRKREVIGTLKSMVDAQCPEQVSCSDLIILAAREAVAASGGPRIQVPLGRRDSTFVPSYQVADANLPSAEIGVDEMLNIFSAKGMTVEESVAILGAHTLGVTHCINIMDRLRGGDPELQPVFGAFLMLNCPQVSFLSNASFVLNDPTPVAFDNMYYLNSISGRGVLRIDAEMSKDPRTAPIVRRFSIDREEFFSAFSSAFVKLSASGVLTGNQGVVRKKCNVLD